MLRENSKNRQRATPGVSGVVNTFSKTLFSLSDTRIHDVLGAEINHG